MQLKLERAPDAFLQDQPPLIREILWRRGFRDEQAARDFLSPNLSLIPNPINSLLDVDLAVKECMDIKEKSEKIVIFGDYDVDGATSTVLLYSVLKAWGFNVDFFIPHRIQDGYGVTERAVGKLLAAHQDVKLVITCDCGIASFEGIAILKSKGVKVVVTDHHEVPKTRVSADAVLNPKQKNCHYPDKKLAGVGVAFLLLIALRRALNLKDFQLNSYLDLVAVGTVCDVAELVGLNRVFVKLGLLRLAKTENLGLQEILRRNGIEGRKITVKDLGFVIGPRLNAAGRVGDPNLGVRTLLSRSESEAMTFVTELEKHNSHRKEIQEIQVREAEVMADSDLRRAPRRAAFVLSNSSFHLGVVGLIASRLAEKYQRPICVLTELQDEHALADFGGQKGLWKGSLRAPIGYHLSDALQKLREQRKDLLLSGGGHAAAAGVAIRGDDLKDFAERFENAISEQGRKEIPLEVDAEFSGADEMAEVLSALEPFGNGNPSPLFYVRNAEVQRVQVMKEIHLKLQTKIEGHPWSVLQFRSPWVRLLGKAQGSNEVKLDFLAELSENEWNGNKRVELVLKDLLDMRVSGKKVEIERQSNEARPS